mmetsp:Transcript_15396/g.19238  ORF Transcript_15396/g.19238 Transcript_15396/m.19238 type:complete len:95 (+) Transcript_15396:36-320(+)
MIIFITGQDLKQEQCRKRRRKKTLTCMNSKAELKTLQYQRGREQRGGVSRFESERRLFGTVQCLVTDLMTNFAIFASCLGTLSERLIQCPHVRN